MLRVKTIKTKICYNQSKKSLFSLLLHGMLLLIVVPCFSCNSQHNVLGHRDQILAFLQADDPRVCALSGLLNIVSDHVLHSRIVHQEVKIAQDFGETVISSSFSYYNILCKSNKHLLLTFQISFQMPL